MSFLAVLYLIDIESSIQESAVANLFLVTAVSLTVGLYWIIWKISHSVTRTQFYGSWILLLIASVYLISSQVNQYYFDLVSLFSPGNLLLIYSLWIIPYIVIFSRWRDTFKIFYFIPVVLIGLVGYLFYLFFFIIFSTSMRFDDYVKSLKDFLRLRLYIPYFVTAVLIAFLCLKDIVHSLVEIRTFLLTNKQFTTCFSLITLTLFSMWTVRERQLLFSRLMYDQINQSAISRNIAEYQNQFEFVSSGNFMVGEELSPQYYICPRPALWPRCEAFRIVTNKNGTIVVVQGRGPFVGTSFSSHIDALAWWEDVFQLQIPNLDSKSW